MERELGQLTQGFTDIKENLVKQDIVLREQNAKLDAILSQATKTNGRVSKLEFWKSAIIWGSGAMWGVAVFSLPYVATIISERITKNVEQALEEKLEEKIEKVLSSYEFDYQPEK